MKQRIITAIALICALGCVTFIFPVLFAPMVAIILAISIWEWCRISDIKRPQAYYVAFATVTGWILALCLPDVLTGFLIITTLHYCYALWLIICYERSPSYKIRKNYLISIGPVVLSTLAACLLYIFHNDDTLSSYEDATSLLFIILVIAASDTGAYFSGRAFGKHALSPRVSPKKTVEGLIGGLLSVVVVVFICQFMVESWYLSFSQLLIISLIAALFSIIGDLFISIIKRQNAIKDSSNILPGHGGILDRLDGLLSGIPVFYLIQQYL